MQKRKFTVMAFMLKQYVKLSMQSSVTNLIKQNTIHIFSTNMIL